MISGIFAELYAFKCWNIILRQTVVRRIYLLPTIYEEKTLKNPFYALLLQLDGKINVLVTHHLCP